MSKICININTPQPNFAVSIEFSTNTIIKELSEKYPKINMKEIEEIVIQEIEKRIIKYGSLGSYLTYEIETKPAIYKNILLYLKKKYVYNLQ